ncbi:DUF1569 domain-containing protein [Spongiivirga citrea]|uniref:DUF1569 domain-containing protein n=1 Tax=Spongiivirga citrea TaxID=1481457 RepID=A0A6M0CH00_9FLAO|nr:DUF1569 domain-containing protein [Spongiivirga citrea]NER16223.1 DUF1569 domain-containing protein [Spongiivirga citrea]
MKSLLTEEAYKEIRNRLENLNTESQRVWGKMNVNQMCKHCQFALEVPLEKKMMPSPNPIMKLVFKAFKSSMYNDKLWKKGLPTPKEFQVTYEPNFEVEKQKLTELVDEFYNKNDKQDWIRHPAFGNFTSEQWGKMQYKHLDHHLRQFNV